MKTYATLGPCCARPELLSAMLAAGLTGFRLNLSHGDLRSQRPLTDAVAEAVRLSGRPAELIIDLRGPELRCGPLERPLSLSPGDTVTLGRDVPLAADILSAIAPGQTLLLDDGALELTTRESVPGGVRCRVERGGLLGSHKSITLPGVELSRPALSSRDIEDLRHAAEQGVTAVMQPFVRRRSELLEVRAALAALGLSHFTLFAKVEDRQGWQALPDWLDACDVVTIARGDLGSDLGLLQLPAAQKAMSVCCRRAGKPFLVVTQLLDSMTHRPTPTRAEVLDVYNAVLDGASALMLTGETASGDYPLESVRWLLDIAAQAVRDRNA